jgi:predicted amidohydrolase YtcJ
VNTAVGEATEAGRRTGPADLVIRGSRIYSLGADGAVHQALATRQGRIVAVADAAHLDEVAPENPVLIKRGGHNDVCNSLALKLGGIGRDTPDQPGGKVFRDASGEPTGLLLETPAFASVEAAMPPPSFEEQVEDLALASADYARKGLCAVRDCAVEPRGEIELLQAVHDRGHLAVRTELEPVLTVVDGGGRWDPQGRIE